ncbi:MAG TPA: ankyrin repeat domain-containing protein [Vicinamibacterales bacterium]|nr:ankyrin repeat domain-containing protein [Vicinamibacterales bacterium]
MTASRSLPPRPSLESLRKQAKAFARDVAAGDADAVARARAQLPHVKLPLTQRNAQLVIAREYGYAGWQDLTAEVRKRLDHDLDWAVAQARRVIHDNDVERLRHLLADYPALLSWHGHDDDGGLVGLATDSYGDSFDAVSEAHFTRAACAEVLIDAGAPVTPSVVERISKSRARGLLELFRRKGLLPRTLKFHAALGDVDALRAAVEGNEANAGDLATVNDAFMVACNFQHEAAASLLLDRSLALDAELRGQVEGSIGRAGFLAYFIDMRPSHATEIGLWKAFVMEQVSRAVSSWSGPETSVASPEGDSDLEAFVGLLRREPWLLGEDVVAFQAEIIERATMKDRGAFISALLDLNPAILRRQPPPPSQAIEFALTYARTHLMRLLTRIWPLPDDLPHAAGMGDLSRVTRWFDESGAPALRDVDRHYPRSPYMPRARVEEYERQWGPHSVQRVLDSAFAWAVMNTHLNVAAFLLDHGADINTRWSSHEPASILHELVWHANYESMRFLIDRGIDMTIRDYRWNSTAQGWALHAAKDAKMAKWLEEAERQRGGKAR